MTEQEINAAVNAAINAWIQEHFSEDQQVMSLTQLPEMSYQDLVDSALTKLMYLVNGTGSTRDRSVQLSTLRKWILEGVSDADLNNVDISGILSLDGSPASTEIVKGRVTVSTSTSKAEITNAGIEISGTDQEPTTEITKNGMTVGNDTVVDKDKVAANKVETAQIRVTSIVEVTTTYDGLSQQQQVSGNPKNGDIVHIWNKSSQGVKVYLSHTSGGGSSTYVTINAGCCIPFMCVVTASAQVYSGWAPQANLQIYSE